MSTAPPPLDSHWALDEYTRSTLLNQKAEELRQNQAVNATNIAGAQQTQEQSAEAFPIAQQSAQLQLEQAKRDAADEIAIRDAYKKSGGDLTKFQQGVQQAGVGPKAALGAVTMVNGMRTSVNNLSESDLKLTQAKHEQFAPMLDEVANADPKDQPGLWAKSIADAQQKGLITPQEAQEHGQYPGPDGAQLYANSLKTVDQLIKQREVTSAEAKGRLENAQAAHQEIINNLAKNSKPGDFDKQVDALVPPVGASGQGQNMFVKSQVNAALSRGDMEGAQKFIDQAYQNQLAINKEIDPRVQAGKVEVAKNTAAARQAAQAGGYGQAGDPMIDMVGTNRVDLATALQRVPPAQKDLFLRNLSAAYPDFNQGTFAVAKKEQTAFTSGSQGQQLTAIGTARNHMQTFKDTAAALDNGDFLKANQVGNYLGMQFGSDKATNFNVARSAFAGEVGKAFAGANVGVSDRQELIDKINAASSPAQLKGYADTADALLAGKQKSLKESYDQGIQGKPNFGGGSGAAAPKYKVGDSVNYKGAPHKITAVDPTTGKLTLAP